MDTKALTELIECYKSNPESIYNAKFVGGTYASPLLIAAIHTAWSAVKTTESLAMLLLRDRLSHQNG